MMIIIIIQKSTNKKQQTNKQQQHKTNNNTKIKHCLVFIMLFDSPYYIIICSSMIELIVQWVVGPISNGKIIALLSCST